MSFSVLCECGRAIPVTEVQAGADVDCRCGRRNAVPLLSALRREAGLDAYKKSTAERIADMVAAGELPRGSQCARCGAFTPETFECIAECERRWRKSSSTWQPVWIPFVGIFWTRTERRVEELGRETNVRMKLRLCADCRPHNHLIRVAWVLRWSKWGVATAAIFASGFRFGLLAAALGLWFLEFALRWLDQRGLNKAFRREAIYQELFAEFPHCIIVRGQRPSLSSPSAARGGNLDPHTAS